MKLSDQNRQWLRKVGFQFNNTSKHPEYFLRVTDNVKIIINIEGYVRVNNHLVRRPRTFADIIDWLGDFGICLCPSGDYAPDDLCPICEDNYTEAERRRTVKGGKKAKRSKESSKEKVAPKKKKQGNSLVGSRTNETRSIQHNPPIKPTVHKKTPATSMHPMRLFGLIGPIGTREAPKGQAIFAQVLAPTTHEARIAFYKDSFRIPDTSKISLEHPYQIVELGGLLLPYVQQMVPYQVISERIHH